MGRYTGVKYRDPDTVSFDPIFHSRNIRADGPGGDVIRWSHNMIFRDSLDSRGLRQPFQVPDLHLSCQAIDCPEFLLDSSTLPFKPVVEGLLKSRF